MSDTDRVRVLHVEGALAKGTRHMEAGEFEQAEAIYERICEERPDRWEGHMGRGQCRLLQRDPGGALKHLSQAIQVNPECMPAYHLLGEIGVAGGVSDVAIERLEFGAQHLPAEPVLFEWLLCLYAMEGRFEDLRGCLFHYSQLRGVHPREAALVFARDPRFTEDLRSRIVAAADF